MTNICPYRYTALALQGSPETSALAAGLARVLQKPTAFAGGAAVRSQRHRSAAQAGSSPRRPWCGTGWGRARPVQRPRRRWRPSCGDPLTLSLSGEWSRAWEARSGAGWSSGVLGYRGGLPRAATGPGMAQGGMLWGGQKRRPPAANGRGAVLAKGSCSWLPLLRRSITSWRAAVTAAKQLRKCLCLW